MYFMYVNGHWFRLQIKRFNSSIYSYSELCRHSNKPENVFSSTMEKKRTLKKLWRKLTIITERKLKLKIKIKNTEGNGRTEKIKGSSEMLRIGRKRKTEISVR